jgi:hypothetical protein
MRAGYVHDGHPGQARQSIADRGLVVDSRDAGASTTLMGRSSASTRRRQPATSQATAASAPTIHRSTA